MSLIQEKCPNTKLIKLKIDAIFLLIFIINGLVMRFLHLYKEKRLNTKLY